MRGARLSAIALALPLGSLLAAPAGATPARREVLPFIADDYTRGVAEARARKVPLFIESWAPW
ncbi:MAG TPA: hypothetical protein VGK89_01540 [Candidatus Eisenbacteria bacterium]|jgi:hypothetical protein